jgi:mevalonate pyrophosphate decarboxylase
MFRKLRIKLFGRSKKQLMKDMNFLCLEMSDILEDMSEDLNDLHESVKESNKLILTIQEQCQEIITMIEKNKGDKSE